MTANSKLHIVTGGAGNLGSAIVRNLASKKLPVRASACIYGLYQNSPAAIRL